MTTWKPAVVDLRCGSCGHAIAKGEIYAALRLGGVKREVVRCPTCAGERQVGQEG
jgi:hypothetical protein